MWLWFWFLSVLLCGGCLPKGGDVEKSEAEPTHVMESFELLGSWGYSGGLEPLTNTMEFTEDKMLDYGDYGGTTWTVTWRIESRESHMNRALLVLTEREGYSRYEVGERLYMTWHLEGDTGRFYFSTEDYVEPKGGHGRRGLFRL